MAKSSLLNLPRAEIVAALCRKSLRDFIDVFWPVIDPAPYVANWHIDAICTHLEAVSRGQIQNLLINIPPGHMKSLLTSVFWPAWEWSWRPERQMLFSSYALNLALRDSIKCRNLIKSDLYRQLFRPSWKLCDDQDTKTHFKNTAHGSRACISVDSGTTGFRGDGFVVDDPLNAKEADSEAARESVLTWWDQGMVNRLNNSATGFRVIIMQRLHEQDLSAHVLAQSQYRWEHLCLPSEFEPQRRCVTSLGWVDPRKEEGELLFPERFPQVELEREKQSKAFGYAGQHQQRPAPAGGGLFKKSWFRYYSVSPDGRAYILHDPVRGDRAVLKSHCTRRFITADTAPTAKQKSDYTCVGTWDLTPDNECLLIDALHEKMEDPDTEKALEGLDHRHHPLFTGIENKQNGTTLMQRLIRKGIRIKSLEAETDKVSRSGAARIDMANGLYYFPQNAGYLTELEAELMNFPNAAHDDWVDMISYSALCRIDTLPSIADWGTVGGVTAET